MDVLPYPGVVTKLPGNAFWHGFADMGAVAGHDFVLATGDGCYVVDEAGNRYLDSTAGLWFCNIGHGRRELAEAAAKQMSDLASYSTFGDFATRPLIDLADRISALAPAEDTKVFFTSGGSDSVETAVKMSRRYWVLTGKPDKQMIITRTHSYHGMHMAGTSIAGIPANRDGYGPMFTEVRNIAWDDAEDLARAIDEVGAENVAAFLCEPVIGAGGVYIAPEGYLSRVREICRERGVHFIADEVICGFGRTGEMFASGRWNLDPDMLLVAKGMTSGYLPMGAVLAAGRIAEPFWSTPGQAWRHGYTYSGHATSAAVALVNLDILESEKLVQAVADKQVMFSASLAPLRDHSFVIDVRAGVGLLGAVQLDPALLAEDPTIGPRLVRAVRDKGVITRLLADGGLQVSPPFTITRDDLRLLVTAVDESLTELGSQRVARSRSNVDLLPEQTRDDSGGFESLEARLLADVPPHHGG
jgi:adenosylmethionine-8-amino-7-oxononanoate aminotransferase